jgi:hypothetical protein
LERGTNSVYLTKEGGPGVYQLRGVWSHAACALNFNRLPILFEHYTDHFQSSSVFARLSFHRE